MVQILYKLSSSVWVSRLRRPWFTPTDAETPQVRAKFLLYRRRIPSSRSRTPAKQSQSPQKRAFRMYRKALIQIFPSADGKPAGKELTRKSLPANQPRQVGQVASQVLLQVGRDQSARRSRSYSCESSFFESTSLSWRTTCDSRSSREPRSSLMTSELESSELSEPPMSSSSS